MSQPQPTAVTFEDGYRRLQEIAERVNSEEVPVHEMCDLFAEGKGLEQALSSYLADQRERVESIERGEGIQAFRIVRPGDDAPAAGAAATATPAAQPTLGADDEIPF
jgi:exodeoxyribonuclease VII small subunit